MLDMVFIYDFEKYGSIFLNGPFKDSKCPIDFYDDYKDLYKNER